VLVAAWNEADSIERHIQSFLGLRYPNRQLVLCAGGSDGTFEQAIRWRGPTITVLQQHRGEGKQRALRRCLEHSDGEIIFLTDADCALDDESFERTLFPVAHQTEQVCSGGSRPHPELGQNPFVVSQAASHLYGDIHRSTYAPGLLGRNCAIVRSLVLASGGLDAPAPTGTDYVLAKVLIAAGARIRQIPESRVRTDYPTTVRGYCRQQRRWLRNVALHGNRFGATNEVRASLATSLVGLTMLGLPIAAVIVGPALFLIWAGLSTHAVLSRIRYLLVARAILGLRVTPQQIAMTLPVLILDFAAWTLPLRDYIGGRGKGEW
jgi:cellulose synthase/poly-beta-1,6-N-acetylglucosamine synthase-like glycosyltransferase